MFDPVLSLSTKVNISAEHTLNIDWISKQMEEKGWKWVE